MVQSNPTNSIRLQKILQMTTILDEVDDFSFSLITNDKIQRTRNSVRPNEAPSQIALLKKSKFKQSFIDGIMQVNNCEFEWNDPNDIDICGSAKILPIDDIINSYVMKRTDSDYTDDNEHWLDFKIVDSVRPEWQVGIFCGKNATNSLYYIDGATPYYLGLNMEGYIKMLIATRGFISWQWALIDYKAGEERTTALGELKEHLPRLFPEVRIEDVFALYDSLYFEEETVPWAE